MNDDRRMTPAESKAFVREWFFSPVQTKKPQTIWVALSHKGHPAPCYGWGFQRRDLKLPAGYRAVKATLVLK